jgi:hypothetical protein
MVAVLRIRLARGSWQKRARPRHASPYAACVSIADAHAEALFCITRSMWDAVTPGLRGVSYLLTDKTLQVRWQYEAAPDEWLRELVSMAETEAWADYWRTHEVEYLAEHVPVTRDRYINWQEDERWVFLRYEPAHLPDRYEQGPKV